LYNSIGTPLDSKYIELSPDHVAMTANHIVVASRAAFYMWQFKNVKQRAIIEVSNKLKAGMEK
jgi:WD repeat-containing protein 35